MNNITLTQLENNNNNYQQLINYFEILDNSFVPNLSSYVNIKEYAEKLIKNAHISILKEETEFVGLCAIYVNNIYEKIAYLSSLAVLDKYKGKGYSTLLMKDIIKTASEKNMLMIKFEVKAKYAIAINFYLKNGFKKSLEPTNDSSTIYMYKRIEDE